MKESPQDVITLHKENQLLRVETVQQKIKNEQITSENEKLRSQLRATMDQTVRTNITCISYSYLMFS